MRDRGVERGAGQGAGRGAGLGDASDRFTCPCVCACLCAAQLHLDEKLDGKPGLQALGVTPTQIEAVGIAFLRRYRSSAYYDAPVDAASHEGQLALRQAADGEEPRPHSAY